MLNLQSYTDTSGDRALLIVHGLYGSGRNWGVIAKRLADMGPVHTVDLRNHGDSFWDDDHSYPALAADLAEVIRHIGAPVDVLGHSMGGKAAMTLALTDPALVASLVVADIAPVAYTHSQIQFIEAMRAVDLERVSRRSDAEKQLAEQGVDPALQSFFTQSLDVQNRRWTLNLGCSGREYASDPVLSGIFRAHSTGQPFSSRAPKAIMCNPSIVRTSSAISRLRVLREFRGPGTGCMLKNRANSKRPCEHFCEPSAGALDALRAFVADFSNKSVWECRFEGERCGKRCLTDSCPDWSSGIA